MAEPSASESSADSDQDFDPTAEMLVNDFDDEHTLDEEEAMESADSVTNELDDLQREGEMPLSEVLAMYGYASRAEYEEGARKDNDDPIPSTSSTKSEPTPEPSTSAPAPSSTPITVSREESSSAKVPAMAAVAESKCAVDEGHDAVEELPEVAISATRPLLRSVHQPSENSDTGTDDDYIPDEDTRKMIQVGSDYQAVIPEGLSEYDDAPAYENEDRLLWDPTKLPDEEVEEYLCEAQHSHAGAFHGVNSVPTGSHIRDDEQALYLLLQCGHNKEEALRRRRMQPMLPADTMSLWSEDECRSFEIGLKTYGKDFHMIQLNKVRTRAVGELVQFYYLWKKTERHDLFASRNRVEKKKYSLHPGTTDYMDRFLDEQDNPTSHRDRSSSPSMHVPLLSDGKKRNPMLSLAAKNEPSSATDSTTTTVHHSQSNADSGTVAAPSTSTDRVRSPSKSHVDHTPSDCKKEYVNGEDRGVVTKDTPICLNSEQSSMGLSYGDKNSTSNPPSEVVAPCLRHASDVTRLHDDSCNSRFETGKDVSLH